MQATSTATSSQNTLSEVSDLPTDAHNGSFPQGCTTVRFSDWGYLPWDNTDNVISAEVLSYIKKARSGFLQIMFLIGGPGNIVNMTVFFRQGLKDRINLLLLFLSLADELFLVTSMVLYSDVFYSLFTGKPNPSPILIFTLNYHLSGFTGSCFISWMLMTIIACERCCCVVWPLKYQTLLSTRTLAVIIIAVYISVLGLHFVVVSKYYITCIYDLDTGVMSKTFGHSEFYQRHKDLVDNIDNIFFGVGLAIAVVVVVTSATAVTTWRLRQAVAWRTQTTAAAVSAKEVALTKMLIGTSVLFLLCVSPSCLRRVASLLLPEMNTGRRHHNLFFACLYISQMFDFINASLNIFIYYAMSSRYRDTLWALYRMTKQDNVK